MKPEELSFEEMRNQLTFMVRLKESTKDLDTRIRTTAMYLASVELEQKHRDVEEWLIEERPDESTIRGTIGGRLSVVAKVKTMDLQGKATMGGRQTDSMKRAAEQLAGEKAAVAYIYLLDPWTVSVVKDSVKDTKVRIMPLLKDAVTPMVRSPSSTRDEGSAQAHEMTTVNTVEDIITRDESVPQDRLIVSPISRTSIRQGFLYIPKEKGELINEGPINIWIRKDASIESRCMVSQTGGIRIGGNLTKWFKSAGLQPNDELVLSAKEDGSLLVMSIKRNSPFKGDTPVVETVKWD